MSKSIYEIVTDGIIEQLENNIIPWNRPWTSVKSGAYNRVSNKPYSLLNQMLLKHNGEYATFKQWTELGGHIKKGAKSEIIVFWKMQKFEEQKEDGTKQTKSVPLLKYYNVFHISQVHGVEPNQELTNTSLEPIEEAEKIKEYYKTREGIKILETITNDAFYSPRMDYIQVPCKEQYSNIEEFYSTLFHEMVHSTGHVNRLNRLTTETNAAFGSEIYSKEELVAEIGSSMMLNILDIETNKSFDNSTSYIQSRLRVPKSDNKFIVSASSKAERAVNYIMEYEV